MANAKAAFTLKPVFIVAIFLCLASCNNRNKAARYYLDAVAKQDTISNLFDKLTNDLVYDPSNCPDELEKCMAVADRQIDSIRALGAFENDTTLCCAVLDYVCTVRSLCNTQSKELVNIITNYNAQDTAKVNRLAEAIDNAMEYQQQKNRSRLEAFRRTHNITLWDVAAEMAKREDK